MEKILVQKDWTPLWSVDLEGMVNGAVEMRTARSLGLIMCKSMAHAAYAHGGLRVL